MVKKYICQDPALRGIPHSETAVKPLKAPKDCKQCSQNKQYGAYYNAAAHLWRTHFRARRQKGAAGSKNGQTKVEEEKEKRGWKDDGGWPSMVELKLWIVEVMVPMDQDGALVSDGDQSVGAMDDKDMGKAFDDAFVGLGEGFGQGIDLVDLHWDFADGASCLQTISTTNPPGIPSGPRAPTLPPLAASAFENVLEPSCSPENGAGNNPTTGRAHDAPKGLSCPYRKRNPKRFNVHDHVNCARPFRMLSDVKSVHLSTR